LNVLVLFETIARKIKPYQKVSYFFAVIFITVFVIVQILPVQAAFIGFDVNNDYGKLGLLGCIWLLLFNMITTVFIDTPKITTKSDSVFTRFKLKVKRFFYFLLAVFFLVLTIIILYLSMRLLRV